ncbi:hypothetical protein SAMN05216410_2431 [Sanguibacter gelidistatuariae]|uniref:Uncharacterized protein n=1 Tax=Sanguibacter gelidistatuariae TaxID=1814289 RepID=A0A1G6Q376_9MICO|nr:hypothetical protein [Sanguibacter gelidistatuariae]SDC86890.1 hypothetical protein SAMN05216410_2431 [Sanguibacter gelidistatuariae]
MTAGSDGSVTDRSAPDPSGTGTPAVAPAQPARQRRHRRVVRAGVETETVSGLSTDEAPTGWSEPPVAGGDSNDEQLKRDVPPHW